MVNCVTHVAKRSPRPYPDATQLPSYHYLKMKYTYHYEDESPRETDDYHHAQLPKLFFAGNIHCRDSEKIEEFSKKYVVHVNLMNEYLEHLTNIEIRENVL